MKLTTALLAAPALVAAQPGGPWWGGSAQCAHNCLQSAWGNSAWPAPSAFCSSNTGPVANCLNQACQQTPAAFQSFTQVSSSLCSQYQSCAQAGSTGVYTITATGPWGPGFGPGGRGGPPGQHWSPNGQTTWGPGVYTVTGCPWSGSPWFSGNNGGNNVGSAWNGWGPTGTGWTWYTQLSTVTTTYTSNGFAVTTTGVATVAEAVSNGFTSMTTYGIGPTSANAAPRETGRPAMGAMAMMGGAVAVAGIL